MIKNASMVVEDVKEINAKINLRKTNAIMKINVATRDSKVVKETIDKTHIKERDV